MGAFDTIVAQFPQVTPSSWRANPPTLVEVLPNWDWSIWLSICLTVVIFIVLESAYRLVRSARDWKIGLAYDILHVLKVSPEIGLVEVARELGLADESAGTCARVVTNVIQRLTAEGHIENTQKGLCLTASGQRIVGQHRGTNNPRGW